MPTLAELWSSVPPPPSDAGDNVFGVRPIESVDGRVLLGRDREQRPALLFSVRPGYKGTQVHRLAHIVVRHNALCRALDESEARPMTLVRCRTKDVILQEYFLQVMGAFLPGSHDIDRTIASLLRLFRSLDMPGLGTVQGLWSELFLIAQASDPALLLSHWHRSPNERIDFATDGERLEVKSFSGEIRRHEFALEQVWIPAPSRGLVASLRVCRLTGGLSLGALLQEVRIHAAGDESLAIGLEEVVVKTLGSSWREGLGFAFDRTLAHATLRFYRAVDIPAPAPPIPSGVTGVHFRSELSDVEPIHTTMVAQMGTLFAAAVPADT